MFRDRDGIQDSEDNCRYNPNAAQLNNDLDREGKDPAPIQGSKGARNVRKHN